MCNYLEEICKSAIWKCIRHYKVTACIPQQMQLLFRVLRAVHLITFVFSYSHLPSKGILHRQLSTALKEHKAKRPIQILGKSKLPYGLQRELACSLAGLNLTAIGFLDRKLCSMSPFPYYPSYLKNTRKGFHHFVFFAF